jgi:hypothetical protein
MDNTLLMLLQKFIGWDKFLFFILRGSVILGDHVVSIGFHSVSCNWYKFMKT